MNKKINLHNLKNLPDLTLENQQKQEIFDRITAGNINRSFWNWLNVGLIFSCIAFIATSINAAVVFSYRPSQLTKIEIPLTVKEASIGRTDTQETTLFVYDENNELAAVPANYNLVNNTLTINLAPGKYRIVLNSLYYNDMVLAGVSNINI